MSIFCLGKGKLFRPKQMRYSKVFDDAGDDFVGAACDDDDDDNDNPKRCNTKRNTFFLYIDFLFGMARTMMLLLLLQFLLSK